MDLSEKPDAIAYRAALAAAGELPERVRNLVLEASGRTDADGRPIKLWPSEGSAEPWPDGPVLDPDQTFCDLVLTTDALYPLILHAPEVAAEVLLALLIEPPERDAFYGNHPFELNLSVRQVVQWSPPMYYRGPFLFFLQKQPDTALRLIVKLLNFTVDRLVDGWERRREHVNYVPVTVGGRERRWVADGRVYGWFRQYNLAPTSVVVALMALEKWLYDELAAERDVEGAITRILEGSNNVAFAGLLLTLGKKDPSLLFGPLRRLLEAPEFYEWDLRITLGGDQHLMLGWTMFPHTPALVKMASEFHTMAHKRILLRDLVTTLIVNDAQWSEMGNEIRGRWEGRIRELPPDDPLKEDLENLVARFDLENYRIEKDLDGKQLWRFTPPEKLRRRWEATQEYLDRRKLLVTFPLVCQQLLEAGISLSANEIPNFWEQITRLAAMDRATDFEPGTIEPSDGVCGGIAVVVCLNRDWLRMSPDKEAWCLDYLEKTISQPPPLHLMDGELSTHTHGWDHFAARTLPVIWAENPSDERVRRSVARLTFAHHYNAVSFLMRSTLDVRQQLGEDCARLEHLILQGAAVRAKHHRFGEPEETKRQRDALSAPLIEAFVSSTLSNKMPRWKEFQTTVHLGPPSVPEERRRTRRELGLDLDFLSYAFDWIPLLEDARNDDERTRWLVFWREALDACLALVRESLDEHGRPKRTQHSFDHWIIRRIAGLIPQLAAAEARTFWLPILEMGTQGHLWVEDFLRNWFGFELDRGVATDSFVLIWKEMWTYARSSKNWEFSGRYDYDVGTLWCSIVGLDSLNLARWRRDHTPCVGGMVAEYQKWAERHLGKPNCCVQFTTFLKRPAAEPLLEAGLEWLEAVVRSESDGRLLEDGKVLQSLAELLDHLWRRQRIRITSSAKTRAAFNAILARVAREGQPLAMELQAQVARSLGS